MVGEIVADRRAGWRWRLVLDGEVLAVASRSFLRRVECDSTLQQFRKMAPTAPVAPGLRIFR